VGDSVGIRRRRKGGERDGIDVGRGAERVLPLLWRMLVVVGCVVDRRVGSLKGRLVGVGVGVGTNRKIVVERSRLSGRGSRIERVGGSGERVDTRVEKRVVSHGSVEREGRGEKRSKG